MLAHVTVRGRVQGVGFRYAAQQHAIKSNLTGWVQNKTDGTVELEVEGKKNNIDQYMKDLKTGFNRFISVENASITTSDSSKGYKEFSIR
ncbi:acylphosphatase [Virgibacillus byunsanensis]|uniref:Acylphosphatase n=1 Tax=Virgibacillus byunsanensis TaxID=570945 RepID=A0ABW3LQF4_9BACI